MTFPNSGGAMPPLPPKSLICEFHTLLRNIIYRLTCFGEDKFRPSFLEKRKAGLVYFLKCVSIPFRYSF